ncbi:MAG: hypothetical protein CM1200mP41_09100 [Gammaproteobacteria bacterium]|nr:MAG: hypothetical protein CM1200mP41_09100 [Gammaproteobacteria bacterium]
MHCLSVVPHNEIIDFPAMGVDKLRLGGMFDQIPEKDTSLSDRPIRMLRRATRGKTISADLPDVF